MIGLTLRAPTTFDAEALAVLATELGYPSRPAEMRRRLDAVADGDAHGVVVAVDAEGRVVGWVHVARHLSLMSDGVAEIAGLVVSEEVRGRGVGSLLVEAAEDWARERGLVEMRVRSRTGRERAHAFHRQMGYEQRRTQLVLGKRLDGDT